MYFHIEKNHWKGLKYGPAYMGQSLLNLRKPRNFAILDNSTNLRIKCLNIVRKFRTKRRNRSYWHGIKSAHSSWEKNDGIHWELLRPIPTSIQCTPSWYLAALLNARSLSSKLTQIQHLEFSSLDILALTETWTRQNLHLEVIKGTPQPWVTTWLQHTGLTRQGEA